MFLIFGPCAFDSPCTAAAWGVLAAQGGGGGGGSSGGGGVNEKGTGSDALRCMPVLVCVSSGGKSAPGRGT